ncbi:BTAD domain-containing putative transcriptional regulator [Pseudonocardia hispaniensis]|uniref:BTAD domain-containing putative transcriptional regulator n=1 Tax=Pseudonocardia hispaniensis TaxID=904933 RepID=A0ABW1IZY7_9PSEU
MTHSPVDLVHVTLLGGFESAHLGTGIALPLGAQRLVAFLALQDGGLHRSAVAERLWPDSSPRRAPANLRSALWRGRQMAGVPVIECVGPRLRLSPMVRVDLQDMLARARQVLAGPGDAGADCGELVQALRRELLPAWTDDWLMLERERWDQTRLHALEVLAQRLQSAGRHLAALEAAFAAVAIEPIRETAHRIVVEVHLAEGNVGSALKHYQRYRSLLARELGVAPSPRMTELASGLLSS